MLVLSRRLAQTIRIGPDVRLTVLRVGRERVELSVQRAPGVPGERHDCGLDDEVRIAPDVRVVVCRLDRAAVRLGIEAPRELIVLRIELAAPQCWWLGPPRP